MVTLIPFLIAKLSSDDDFLRLKELAIVHDNWRLEYDKKGIKIWSKSASDAAIKMMKVWSIFAEVNPMDVYNALMDSIYRKKWDNHFIMGYDIGYLNDNNGVCYYAISCPPPLRSRDFVLQTSWLDKNTELYMFNHSVCHKDHPPRPGFIRAVSYFTGYYIKTLIDYGCELTFVTQVDPQGIVPTWIVNKCTQIFAPRYIKKLEKAAMDYRSWKNENNPTLAPWLYPEQIRASRISVSDCVPSLEERQSSFFRNLIEKERQRAKSNGTVMFKSSSVSFSGASHCGNYESKEIQETKDNLDKENG